MALLLLKLLLVPALVLLLTLAGRRWGPVVSGWLAGLPLVAGPALLFLALDQGAVFATAAAHAALTAVPANAAFLLCFAWAGLRLPGWAAGLLGVTAFALAAGALAVWRLPPLWALVAALAGLQLAAHLFPRVGAGATAAVVSRWELPTRCLAAGVLVLLVTLPAQRLGPVVSGLLAVFPVLGLVLGVFTHRAGGGAGAARLLAGMVRGMRAFAAFCFVVAVALPGWGTGAGFAAAVAVALGVQLLTFRRPPAAARAPAPSRAGAPGPRA